MTHVEVAIVGGGAAGVAAARRLADAGVDALLIEARPRLGGRAWTIVDPVGGPLDLGCGWLHSGDRNPWTEIAERQGRAVDRSLPPWARRTLDVGFPPDQQADFEAANERFRRRLEAGANCEPDVAASAFLEPGGRWNGLIDAISTYVSGAELDRVSARDLVAYADSGVNWRVVGGYGAAITAHIGGARVALDCPVSRIDHGGRRVRLDTPRGEIIADRVIVTLPSSLIAQEAVAFSPALPQKVEAAAGLPLGLADKLYLALEGAEAFEPDNRVFGSVDRVATASYHLRAHGLPIIECYFGGALAAELERGGRDAFRDYASGELSGLFGAAFAKRISPIAWHGWAGDPFARGSYSYALPGRAPARQTLAEPVGDRLFFAGEACSRHDYSTAHGAYRTGLAAAEAVIALPKRS